MQADDTGWPWRFRRKASFVFDNGPAPGALTIGHYAARSRSVVSIVECPVHSDRANQIAFALHGELAKTRIAAAGASLRGVLRHLLVRTTGDEREAVAMLVVTRNEKALRGPIRKFLAGADKPTGFFLNIHDRPGPYMVGRETIRLEGRSHVRESVGGLSFLVSPAAFFQTNVDAAAVLLDLVKDAVPKRPRLNVLDLYAGSGLFALPLAAAGHRVIAVEENAQAIGDGEANIRLNRLSAESVRFWRGRVEELLPRLRREPIDFAVLDPPRDGCAPEILKALFGDIAPARVVYVSCNPEALASELPEIAAFGYSITRVQPVDMFPHTTHIETVVTLDRRPAKPAGLKSRPPP